eukprot:352159-Chlamydomonas_euryale.AAC.7
MPPSPAGTGNRVRKHKLGHCTTKPCCAPPCVAPCISLCCCTAHSAHSPAAAGNSSPQPPSYRTFSRSMLCTHMLTVLHTSVARSQQYVHGFCEQTWCGSPAILLDQARDSVHEPMQRQLQSMPMPMTRFRSVASCP